MAITKPFMDLDGLVSLLDSRGLSFENTEVRDFLERVNYYRFSGYAREFQIAPTYGDNRFMPGTTFNQIKTLMTSDAELRHLLLTQLEVVEISIRARLAHELGREHGSSAFYLNVDAYVDIHNKPELIVEGISRDLSRSNSRMIAHYADTSSHIATGSFSRYRDVPIWVAVEVLSFGRITNMLTYLKDFQPAKRVAESMNVQWAPFTSVVHSLSVLRNACAHWMQLWQRALDIQCPVQKKLKPRGIRFTPNSVYAAIIMLNHYREKIDGDTRIAENIEQLLASSAEFGAGIRTPAMR